MNYEQKYLKYKKKYLSLKSQYGGVIQQPIALQQVPIQPPIAFQEVPPIPFPFKNNSSKCKKSGSWKKSSRLNKLKELKICMNGGKNIDMETFGDLFGKKKNGSLLEVGMKVEANFKGEGKYYKGKITRVNPKGTYDIKYDGDDDTESNKGADMIRILEEVRRVTKDGEDPSIKFSDMIDIGIQAIKKNVDIPTLTDIYDTLKEFGPDYNMTIKEMALYESSNLSGYSLINEILGVVYIHFNKEIQEAFNKFKVENNLKNLNLSQKIEIILDFYSSQGDRIKVIGEGARDMGDRTYHERIDVIIWESRRNKGYQNFNIFDTLHRKFNIYTADYDYESESTKSTKYNIVKTELEREMNIYLVNDVLKLASERKNEEFKNKSEKDEAWVKFVNNTLKLEKEINLDEFYELNDQIDAIAKNIKKINDVISSNDFSKTDYHTVTFGSKHGQKKVRLNIMNQNEDYETKLDININMLLKDLCKIELVDENKIAEILLLPSLNKFSGGKFILNDDSDAFLRVFLNENKIYFDNFLAISFYLADSFYKYAIDSKSLKLFFKEFEYYEVSYPYNEVSKKLSEAYEYLLQNMSLNELKPQVQNEFNEEPAEKIKKIAYRIISTIKTTEDLQNVVKIGFSYMNTFKNEYIGVSFRDVHNSGILPRYKMELLPFIPYEYLNEKKVDIMKNIKIESDDFFKLIKKTLINAYFNLTARNTRYKECWTGETSWGSPLPPITLKGIVKMINAYYGEKLYNTTSDFFRDTEVIEISDKYKKIIEDNMDFEKFIS